MTKEQCNRDCGNDPVWQRPKDNRKWTIVEPQDDPAKSYLLCLTEGGIMCRRYGTSVLQVSNFDSIERTPINIAGWSIERVNALADEYIEQQVNLNVRVAVE